MHDPAALYDGLRNSRRTIGEIMGTAYEVALVCNLKPTLSPQIMETLNYLTRSQDYDFPKAISHLFFDVDFGDEWRIIIANNYPRGGEDFSPQACRSVLSNNQLCFRVLLDDDTFYNVGWFLLDWLATISDTQGLVGYRIDIVRSECTLIFFKNEQVIEHQSLPSEIPEPLKETFNRVLGGTGFFPYE